MGTPSQTPRGGYVNSALIQATAKQVAPIPQATAAFALISFSYGYGLAGTGGMMLLNSIATGIFVPLIMNNEESQQTYVQGITMDEAVDKAARFVGPNGNMETTGRGSNFQFRVTERNANGNLESRMGRFDINPADPTVQRVGPHLNLERQINGIPRSNTHLPIDPATIRLGDFPKK